MTLPLPAIGCRAYPRYSCHHARPYCDVPITNRSSLQRGALLPALGLVMKGLAASTILTVYHAILDSFSASCYSGYTMVRCAALAIGYQGYGICCTVGSPPPKLSYQHSVESGYSLDTLIYGAPLLGYWVVTPSLPGGYLQAHCVAVIVVARPSNHLAAWSMPLINTDGCYRHACRPYRLHTDDHARHTCGIP